MGDFRKVIIFPKAKKTYDELEEQVEKLIDEGSFADALSLIEHLFAHEIYHEQLYLNQLIIYMRLKDWDNAEELCLSRLNKVAAPIYYDYLEFYFIILFETNQYNTLLKKFTEEKEDTLPESHESRLKQLYHLCYEINLREQNHVITDLINAVNKESLPEQWRQYKRWSNLQLNLPDIFIELLVDNRVHPLLKTYILEKLISEERQITIEVEKFGLKKSIDINELRMPFQQESYLAALELLSETEDDNPTLALLMKELLQHYCFVFYPFTFTNTDVSDVVLVIKSIACFQLGIIDQIVMDKTDKTRNYESQIKFSNELYLQTYL